MAAQLVDSQRVDGLEGTRVQVLFYADHSIRFRVHRTPMVIEEAFLTGNKQQNTIVKLAPRPSVRRGVPDSFRTLGIKAQLTGGDDPCGYALRCEAACMTLLTRTRPTSPLRAARRSAAAPAATSRGPSRSAAVRV